ncbi:OLC1v1000554C1 [Oldenlandia corymbosa var. corymbosa]|uniref:OLC1v1000554C1 n=1 Tax=Oldenlandia corymbosa var. corymbosa TaxID=529605 RepID=A0AAV1D3H8_OLDCO|nr:OLC1v1000554C1 [Oldenlandia corymbosa var. corymbosa]
MESCIGSALDDLDSIGLGCSGYYLGFEQQLGCQLRLMKTIYGFGRKRAENGVGFESGLRNLEENAYRESLQIHILFLTLRNANVDLLTFEAEQSHLFCGVISCFRVMMDLGYLPYYHLTKSLLKSLEFLKNLIRFAIFRGLEISQMEDMLIHAQGLRLIMLIHAQGLCLKSACVPGEDEVEQLMERSKPVEYHVLLRGTCYMNMFDHQIHTLYEGLRFLRTTLREHHHDKFDEELLYDDEKVQNIIGVFLCETGLSKGLIVCYLFVKIDDSSHVIERLQDLFFEVEKKIKLFQKETEEEAPRYLLNPAASCFPQTNLLGFIDSVLIQWLLQRRISLSQSGTFWHF